MGALNVITPVLTPETAHMNFNNFANESNWRNLCVDNRTNSNIFFDVELRPLCSFLKDGIIDNGEQCVFDIAESRIIKVHGSKYALLKNSIAYDMVNEAINELGRKGILDVDGMHITDSCVAKGGKTIRQYVFPNHSVNVDGSDVLMRIVVINSYDGSANFSLQVGGFRIVCLNGMVSGSKFLNLNQRHSGNIQLGNIQNRLTTSVKSFEQLGEYWKKMISTPLTQKVSDNILAQYTLENGRMNIKKFSMMCDLYENHVKDLGRNYWAMYNALTAHATHYKVQERNIHNRADVILGRENHVSSLINNKKVWQV
ncbi:MULTISPECIES: DUF932 domain-containing protein [Vibrio]|uniref:DUF932 domain-containing protein n=1 Tax=Vibrio TaxID=662 RepID=UPI002075AB32|nr:MULTISPECIES: DUF932 domain-containing protein [Vibrio]USD35471.1 DUF932 domain-containing protein [Vibrio sp. SCSIO 43186]USD72595.1 DUF932 domain-containing protein [Vibrio sp. SCSIO 43139]USD98986.1 hypothetical protein CTT30_23215 [Vibrio coralliilyticus]